MCLGVRGSPKLYNYDANQDKFHWPLVYTIYIKVKRVYFEGGQVSFGESGVRDKHFDLCHRGSDVRVHKQILN